jgi:hypothetical protein
MITKEFLQNTFEYKNNCLYWKNCKRNGWNGKKAGSIHLDGYVYIQLEKIKYKEHRLVFLLFNDFLPKFIDHINGNKSDNRIENLREANHSENMMNTKIRITNKTGIKGVNWHKASNKWTVQLMVNQKKKYFGIYDDIELAELVAIEARNKYHGEFARHK